MRRYFNNNSYFFFLLSIGFSACMQKSLVLSPTLKEPDKAGFIVEKKEQQTVYTRFMEYSNDFIVFDAEFINQSSDSVAIEVDSFRYEVTNVFADSSQWVNIGIRRPNDFSKELRQKVRNARIGQALLIVGAVALEVAAASAENKSLNRASDGIARTQQRMWYSAQRFDRINAMANIISNNTRHINYLNMNWKFYDENLIRNKNIGADGRVIGLVVVPRFDQAKKVRIIYYFGGQAFPFEFYQYFK